jgi:transposase
MRRPEIERGRWFWRLKESEPYYDGVDQRRILKMAIWWRRTRTSIRERFYEIVMLESALHADNLRSGSAHSGSGPRSTLGNIPEL